MFYITCIYIYIYKGMYEKIWYLYVVSWLLLMVLIYIYIVRVLIVFVSWKSHV